MVFLGFYNSLCFTKIRNENRYLVQKIICFVNTCERLEYHAIVLSIFEDTIKSLSPSLSKSDTITSCAPELVSI